MDTLTSEYLRKLQSLQVRYGELFNSFDVQVVWVDYYETVLRCVYSDDNGRYMADFTQCVYEEDFKRIYNQLAGELAEYETSRNYEG